MANLNRTDVDFLSLPTGATNFESGADWVTGNALPIDSGDYLEAINIDTDLITGQVGYFQPKSTVITASTAQTTTLNLNISNCYLAMSHRLDLGLAAVGSFGTGMGAFSANHIGNNIFFAPPGASSAWNSFKFSSDDEAGGGIRYRFELFLSSPAVYCPAWDVINRDSTAQSINGISGLPQIGAFNAGLSGPTLRIDTVSHDGGTSNLPTDHPFLGAVLPVGTITGLISPGDTLTSTGGSATVLAIKSTNLGGTTKDILVTILSGTFSNGETVTSTENGGTAVLQANQLNGGYIVSFEDSNYLAETGMFDFTGSTTLSHVSVADYYGRSSNNGLQLSGGAGGPIGFCQASSININSVGTKRTTKMSMKVPTLNNTAVGFPDGIILGSGAAVSTAIVGDMVYYNLLTPFFVQQMVLSGVSGTFSPGDTIDSGSATIYAFDIGSSTLTVYTSTGSGTTHGVSDVITSSPGGASGTVVSTKQTYAFQHTAIVLDETSSPTAFLGTPFSWIGGDQNPDGANEFGDWIEVEYSADRTVIPAVFNTSIRRTNTVSVTDDTEIVLVGVTKTLTGAMGNLDHPQMSIIFFFPSYFSPYTHIIKDLIVREEI